MPELKRQRFGRIGRHRTSVRCGDLGMLCFLAEIYVELADHTAARALYPKLAPYAERNAVGAAFDYCGMLADSLGDIDAAAHHLERAESISQQLRMPLQAARSAHLQNQLHKPRA